MNDDITTVRRGRFRSISQLGLFALLFLAVVMNSSVRGASVGTLADSSGEVVAWGNNFSGQTSVPAGSFATVAAGLSHSLGIRSDGTLAGWGDNAYGQTNVPTGTFAVVAAGGAHSLGIRTDGTLAGWGENGADQTAVPLGTFLGVAGGMQHSFGIRSDGTLAGWGNNFFGQAGVPSGAFLAIESGDFHSLGIRTNGTLAGWGFNEDGQTNVPAGTFTAVAAGGDYSLGIRTDGTLAGWGDNVYGQTTVPAGTFSAVAGGGNFSLGIRSDGTLAGWGYNAFGQTDVPPGAFTAVATGYDYGLALQARTDYDGDLVVSYTGVPYGPEGLKANLNRSVEVAGDARISSWMYLRNNPTLTIGGKLVLEPGGWLAVVDAGTVITYGGIDVRPGALLFVPANLTLTSAGPLMGRGGVDVDGNLSIGLSRTSSFTGDLWLRDNSVLTFSGTGAVTPNRLDALYNADVRLGAGQRFEAGWIENFGKIEALGNPNVLGGVAEVECRDGGFNANGTGLITGHDAVFRFGTGLSNDGAIALTGGVNDIFGDITNNRGPDWQSTLVVTGGSQTTFYDDVTNNSQIVVRKLGGVASTATFLGSYSGTGSTSGGGDIIFEGDLKPGNSPAAVLMDNNVAFGSGARLAIELGGTTPGSQYDQLLVAGELALGGTLDVDLVNLGAGVFQPQLGSVFEIASAAGGIIGSFTTEQMPGLGPLLEMQSVQTANELLLTVVPALTGDYNVNGVVDAADYVAWRNTVGQSGIGLPADGDGDGDVDTDDRVVWRAHFGQVTAVGRAADDGAAHAIPEPAAWMMVVVLGTFGAARHSVRGPHAG